MRIFFVTIILLASLCLSGCVFSPETAMPEELQIKIIDEKTTTVCIGTRINDGYIISVAHIFDRQYESDFICAAIDSDDCTYKLEPVSIDRKNDLSLFHIKDASYEKTTTISLSHPQGTVYAYSDKKLKKTSFCTTVGCAVAGKPETLLKVGFSVKQGESGTALVTAEGKIAGIICANASDSDCCYAISAKVVEAFLEKNDFFTSF